MTMQNAEDPMPGDVLADRLSAVHDAVVAEHARWMRFYGKRRSKAI